MDGFTQIDERIDPQMDGLMERWMDSFTDGWTDTHDGFMIKLELVPIILKYT